MTKRNTTGDERALFERAFAETRPLKTAKAANPSRAKSAESPGLDGNTAEKLRRGALDPEARLDLHGFTLQAAHQALLKFLRGAHRRGFRLVLVVTGKDAPDEETAPFDLGFGGGLRGAIRNAVPRWFREPQFAELIAGTQLAHRRHGGEGAFYVYLRKVRR
jgi:DNA-nicking Smr family endonuclease